MEHHSDNVRRSVAVFAAHCCGCGECAALCPVGAITMQENEQGFRSPAVNEAKCTGCGLCASHCSFNRVRSEQEVTEAWAVHHTDEKIRAASRSGGVFTAVTDRILARGGAVYGCALTDCRHAVHTRAVTREERDAFRGSKYIQSTTDGVYDAVRADVAQGLWVLFSGTACQVAAVKDYCAGLDCSRLVLLDIVCHGVPSPRVWSDYLDTICAGRTPTAVDFRDKQRFGWAAHRESVTFSDGSVYSGETFRQLFYDHLILRRDCFACPYKSLRRVGDLTIADCWGIAEHAPDFDDNRGVSLVLIGSGKGRALLDESMGDLAARKVSIADYLQPPLRENWPAPKRYDAFWAYYRSHSFNEAVRRFLQPSLLTKAKCRIARVLKL